MAEPAIVVDNISKSYRLGRRGSARGTLVETLSNLFRRDDAAQVEGEILWALRDVSFEVQVGEVVGIIGSNGAGKSTLLKILSRITSPSAGRAVIRGRVSSLLEVGTGFHMELTGRENVYMNGSILGMSKSEIDRKFDEIVDFAGVERFLDTPIKRYSSGMTVRLAFAVAAHLEPEILIIDEVLAVGDAEFQQKCLGKIGAVAGQGRTVLFVSHNLSAVQFLCERGVLLAEGRVLAQGPTDEVLARYRSRPDTARRALLDEAPRTGGSGSLRLTEIALVGSDVVRTGGPLRVLIRFRATEAGVRATALGLSLWTMLDERIISVASDVTGNAPDDLVDHVVCTIPELPLLRGVYWLNASILTPHGIADYVIHALSFEVEDGDFYGTGRAPHPAWARIVVPCEWSLLPADSLDRA